MELGHENTCQLIGGAVIGPEIGLSVIVLNRGTASR